MKITKKLEPMSMIAIFMVVLIAGLLLSIFFDAYQAHADETINFQSTSNENDNLGVVDSQLRFAHSFVPSANAVSGTAHFYAIGNSSPDGNYVVTIEADSGGEPSGTPLVTTTIAANTIGTSGSCNSDGGAVVNSSFTASLTSGTTYWVVIKRTGQTTGYILVCEHSGTSASSWFRFPFPAGPWTSYNDNEAKGSIDLVADSGGGGGDEGTTTADTEPCTLDHCNVDNPVADLFYGFIIMWINIFFWIWFFRKKS